MEINDFKPKRNKRGKPILRSQVEDAVKNTRSNNQAAKYIGVNILTYKKYAQLYGLWDQHSNKKGIGVSKGFIKNSIKLEDVFDGKYPTYSLVRLKHRMIARRMLAEDCSYCGFNERRIKDKKSPLILTFKDGNRQNFAKDNLHLVCYNCMFLTAGVPNVAHRSTILTSFNYPERFKGTEKIKVDLIERSNPPEPTDDDILANSDIDFDELRNQLLDELEET